MSIGQALLPEFDHEMANTRKTLERVPEDKVAWKPHEKSMTMGQLAQHTCEIPCWIPMVMEKDSLDVNPPGSPPHEPPMMKSRKELLETFDKSVKSARAALSAVSDERLMKSWSLLAGGKAYFTMPRIAVLRGFVMNHMIHHRAQLGVYLRLNNLPVPSIYGPSADEGSM